MPIRWRCRNCRRDHDRKLHENDWAFIQETINGIFHRESLHTQSPKEAQRRYRKKLKEYQTATPDPSKGTRKLKKLTIAEAIELYIEERKADVSKAQVKAWRDINWQKKFLTIMRSKTQAGWRYPSLNETCLAALRMLRDQAVSLGIAEPDHYVFPYHPRGRFRKNEPPLDPTRPMTKYARQSISIQILYATQPSHATKIANLSL